MKYLFSLLALTATISLPAGLQAESADPFANVEMKAQPVSGSVHMLEGAGGNIGVSVGADGTLIIDDQFAPLADKIIAGLQELGGDRPRLILNTHWHGDHTGSNPEMGKTGTIISHNNVRVRLLGEEDYPRSGLPLVTFDENLNVHFNDEEITLLHLPTGHTDGDTVVWFKQANVIHMGDLFFNHRFPFVDLASGGSIDGFITNVNNILSAIPDDIKIIPGHGPLATKADLTNTINTVEQSVALIRDRLADGDTAEQVTAVIDADYAEWASGFINASRWVQIVQADLSASTSN
ncbi:MAG: MBL fold metallo-hydrolase [Pseudomonadota bacterium]